MKRLFFIISILFLVGAGCSGQPLSTGSDQSSTTSDGLIGVESNTNASLANNLPASFDVKVAFASQAPLGDWGMPYQEACEEASMVMAAKYFKNEKLDSNIMNDEILKLAKWENDNGYPIDLTAAQVVEVLDKYFGIKSSATSNVTTDVIKHELVAGNLIILPLAGRDIGNPYFQTPGPLYHMLVVRGYNKTDFITNDPGTKRGEAYRYKYNVLLSAVHDWTGGVRIYKDPRPEPDMSKGAKVMIVVEK
jgi:hypothetical protein